LGFEAPAIVAAMGEQMIALKLPSVSFGAVSAIVTSLGLIIGFGTAGISKPTVVAGLLVVGLADNLTDSLSIHIYQESEKLLGERVAFRATLGNFVTRLVISLSFVMLVLAFSSVNTILASLAWGVSLLTGLTWLVARSRGANVTAEIIKHLAMVAVVVAVSRGIGTFIGAYIQ
jgi:hypothetical protein